MVNGSLIYPKKRLGTFEEMGIFFGNGILGINIDSFKSR